MKVFLKEASNRGTFKMQFLLLQQKAMRTLALLQITVRKHKATLYASSV